MILKASDKKKKTSWNNLKQIQSLYSTNLSLKSFLSSIRTIHQYMQFFLFFRLFTSAFFRFSAFPQLSPNITLFFCPYLLTQSLLGHIFVLQFRLHSSYMIKYFNLLFAYCLFTFAVQTSFMQHPSTPDALMPTLLNFIWCFSWHTPPSYTEVVRSILLHTACWSFFWQILIPHKRLHIADIYPALKFL